MSKILMWIVWNVPLGKLAPYVLGLAMGSKPQKIRQEYKEKNND